MGGGNKLLTKMAYYVKSILSRVFLLLIYIWLSIIDSSQLAGNNTDRYKLQPRLSF